MNISNKKVRMLVFGGGPDQLTMIKQCKELGFHTVVIDPNPEAVGQNLADGFEVVGGQDFENTCQVVEKHKITHIITVATDKPLIMMARIAKKYGFLSISEESALNCTDKLRMKETFVKHNIPCANYKLISELTDDLKYPLVLKPRDNSGSRGVTLCYNRQDAEIAFADAIKFTKLDTILCEEVMEGKEYSLESVHWNGKTKLLQITDKIMTALPYSCEMELTHPSLFTVKEFKEIENLVHQISLAFGFTDCASHNEIRIKDGKIKVLEASGRLAGDYICSHLVPLSTGINMEKCLIDIVTGNEPDFSAYNSKASGIYYFEFKEGVVRNIGSYDHLKSLPEVIEFKFNLKVGSI
ncbi:MAG: ATP-grasp domain-containing protein, partial [Salinivirgaceae bacterium]|nr:ATP-grasp domain-containing protein [Salinivirgaceae bacterium]